MPDLVQKTTRDKIIKQIAEDVESLLLENAPKIFEAYEKCFRAYDGEKEFRYPLSMSARFGPDGQLFDVTTTLSFGMKTKVDANSIVNTGPDMLEAAQAVRGQ